MGDPLLGSLTVATSNVRQEEDVDEMTTCEYQHQDILTTWRAWTPMTG